MFDELGRRHFWGFGVVPGQSVGGGLFTEVKLDDNEVVTDTIMCSLGDVWLPAGGYLVLTNQRLIFIPYRWPMSLVHNHPISVAYSQVAGCREEIVREAANPVSFFLSALIVDDSKKSRLTLRPVGAVEPIIAKIERMRGTKVAL